MTLDKQIILMEELLSDDDHWSSKKAKSEYKQLLKWLKDYKRLLEMPKGDLISREALKKDFEKVYPLTTNEMGGIVNKRIYDIIDNAPTVAVDCKDCDGYEAGYSAGLKDAERPKGEYETACNVLLSLEQIVRSSDGWEESAVEAVHNAVQTAIKCMHERQKGGNE